MEWNVPSAEWKWCGSDGAVPFARSAKRAAGLRSTPQRSAYAAANACPRTATSSVFIAVIAAEIQRGSRRIAPILGRSHNNLDILLSLCHNIYMSITKKQIAKYKEMSRKGFQASREQLCVVRVEKPIAESVRKSIEDELGVPVSLSAAINETLRRLSAK